MTPFVVFILLILMSAVSHKTLTLTYYITFYLNLVQWSMWLAYDIFSRPPPPTMYL